MINRDILITKKPKKENLKKISTNLEDDVKNVIEENRTSVFQLIERHLVKNDPMKCLSEAVLSTVTAQLVNDNSAGKPSSYSGDFLFLLIS